MRKQQQIPPPEPEKFDRWTAQRKAVGVVADTSGNAYVTAFPHNFIDYYAAGSTTPTSIITDPQLSSVYFIAMDKSRNVFTTVGD